MGRDVGQLWGSYGAGDGGAVRQNIGDVGQNVGWVYGSLWVDVEVCVNEVWGAAMGQDVGQGVG